YELLDIVGDIRAEVIAARAQFAWRQLLARYIVKEQGLHAVDVAAAAAVEFVLDDVEQAAVEPRARLHEVLFLPPTLPASAMHLSTTGHRVSTLESRILVWESKDRYPAIASVSPR